MFSALLLGYGKGGEPPGRRSRAAMARGVSARLRWLMAIAWTTTLQGGALYAHELDGSAQELDGSDAAAPPPSEPDRGASDDDSPPELGSRSEAEGEQCLSSHRAGQRLEREGRLLGATRAYRRCLSPNCSPVLREDCAARLAVVESDIPTVILAAQYQGRDLARVDVYDADVLLQRGITGIAVPVDPGPHQLRFVAPGFAPRSHPIVARVGEKNRLVVVALDVEEGAALPAMDSAAVSPTSRVHAAVETSRSGLGVWDYALFTTGALLGAGGATLGVLAFSEHRKARAECAPTCSNERMESIRSKAIAADALFVLSAAAVITGSVRVILAQQPSRGEAALVLSPGFVSAEGRF